MKTLDYLLNERWMKAVSLGVNDKNTNAKSLYTNLDLPHKYSRTNLRL